MLGWLAFTALVLLIPLIAMQFTDEVNWRASDFLLMGAALLGIGTAYELIATNATSIRYRIALIIGLLGAFLLFWVNAAVGIIGSENQEVNRLFAAIFIIGLVGTFISRFRSKGMAITMYVLALVQLLVTVIALIVWPPPIISWTPSVLGVFLISGFFALIFCLSGILFARSST